MMIKFKEVKFAFVALVLTTKVPIMITKFCSLSIKSKSEIGKTNKAPPKKYPTIAFSEVLKVVAETYSLH